MKENKGITLMTLVITIIVLLILAGISLNEGTSLIKKAKVENIMTNMITIKAKAKVIAEEVNAQVWNLAESDKLEKKQELYTQEYKMGNSVSLTTEQINALDSQIGNSYECYLIITGTLEKMGLSDIQDGDNYVVVYNLSDYTKLDIVFLSGIQYEGTMYYTLSKLQEKFEI